jgi:hypothetical protein
MLNLLTRMMMPSTPQESRTEEHGGNVSLRTTKMRMILSSQVLMVLMMTMMVGKYRMACMALEHRC